MNRDKRIDRREIKEGEIGSWNSLSESVKLKRKGVTDCKRNSLSRKRLEGVIKKEDSVEISRDKRIDGREIKEGEIRSWNSLSEGVKLKTKGVTDCKRNSLSRKRLERPLAKATGNGL